MTILYALGYTEKGEQATKIIIKTSIYNYQTT